MPTKPTNAEAYRSHLNALKLLNEAFGNAPNETAAVRLRAVIRKVRDELYEMVIRDLERNTGAYEALTPKFKAMSKDLNYIKDRVDSFQLAVDRASQLSNWAARFLPIMI